MNKPYWFFQNLRIYLSLCMPKHPSKNSIRFCGNAFVLKRVGSRDSRGEINSPYGQVMGIVSRLWTWSAKWVCMTKCGERACFSNHAVACAKKGINFIYIVTYAKPESESNGAVELWTRTHPPTLAQKTWTGVPFLPQSAKYSRFFCNQEEDVLWTSSVSSRHRYAHRTYCSQWQPCPCTKEKELKPAQVNQTTHI